MRGDIFSLSGRKILVTGAAGHLGRALCVFLAHSGASVLAADSNQAQLANLREEIQRLDGAITVFAVDLSSESERIGLTKDIMEHDQVLDGVVFAAALVGSNRLDGWATDFMSQSLDTWRSALEINLTAPFHLVQLLVPLLRRGSGSSVVNVGSIYGSVAPDWSLYEGLDMSNPAAYAASKGGLLQLTRWLSSSLAPDIRVNSVAPGGIFRNQPSEFVDRYSGKTPLRRMASEEDVVGAIGYLLSAASSYVTGHEIVVDGGFTSL